MLEDRIVAGLVDIALPMGSAPSKPCFSPHPHADRQTALRSKNERPGGREARAFQ
jgi:hypothetical protein